MRDANRSGAPGSSKTNVKHEWIVLYHDRRGEAEAVVFGVPSAPIDGDVTDWLDGYGRFDQRKAAYKPH
ncbi:MAG: hypothetical protein ACLQOQ_03035 [Beijerinckiaceae bacterium]